MPRSVHWQIRSDPAGIASVRSAIEAFACTAGMDEKTCGEIGLCINEALANIIRHAYGGADDRPILLTAQRDDHVITITIRDWGNGVDPSSRPPEPYNPLTPGGLGLICLKQLMDDVHFAAQPDGMLLTMKKSLPPAGVQAKD